MFSYKSKLFNVMCLFLIACGGSSSTSNGCGGEVKKDASPVVVDAGVVVIDSSVAPVDASVPKPIDASVSPKPDAAPVKPDASVPPQPSQFSVNVTLIPQYDSVVGNSSTVSFGLPVPVGTLAHTDNVRVTKDGKPIIVFVKSLGDWQYMPPKELLCSGIDSPTFKGVRSVLIQFPYTFTSKQPIDIKVEIGQFSELHLPSTAEVNVIKTMTVVDDGKLYKGMNASTAAGNNWPHVATEPTILPIIQQSWLACSGLSLMVGKENTLDFLKATDNGRKNHFHTSVMDYRTNWDAEPGSWPATTQLELYAGDSDTSWLYLRPETFLNGYMYSGFQQMMKEYYKASYHYMTLLWRPEDCPNNAGGQCAGYFMLKDQNPLASYFDFKYSYNESLANYYWLTGNEVAKQYLQWITTATNRVRPDVRTITDRFTAYALAAALYQYDVVGDVWWIPTYNAMMPENLSLYIKRIVDYLYKVQNTLNSEGIVTGCISGGGEVGDPNSVSTWMASLLNNSLLRAYYVTNDPRIPQMIVKQANCMAERGVYYDNGRLQSGTKLLIPYMETFNSGIPHDNNGDDPWAQVEHSLDVGVTFALGAYFEQDEVKKQAFIVLMKELVKSHEWALKYWTRTSQTLPKFRNSPARKYLWWYKNAHVLSWPILGKQSL